MTTLFIFATFHNVHVAAEIDSLFKDVSLVDEEEEKAKARSEA